MTRIFAQFDTKSCSKKRAAGRQEMRPETGLCRADSLLSQRGTSNARNHLTFQGVKGYFDPRVRCGAGGGTRTPTSLWKTDFRTSYGFRRPLTGFVVWTIPSPWREGTLGAARLVSTPFPPFRRDLARGCHIKGFPEFEQFYVPGFPGRTQFASSPLRLPVSPRPRDHTPIATRGTDAKRRRCAYHCDCLKGWWISSAGFM